MARFVLFYPPNLQANWHVEFWWQRFVQYRKRSETEGSIQNLALARFSRKSVQLGLGFLLFAGVVVPFKTPFKLDLNFRSNVSNFFFRTWISGNKWEASASVPPRAQPRAHPRAHGPIHGPTGPRARGPTGPRAHGLTELTPRTTRPRGHGTYAPDLNMSTTFS